MINESFNCENCWLYVEKHPNGSARNHCPSCLYSKHLDKDFPWDRSSKCFGIMKPIGTELKKNKWTMIVHKCKKCEKKILNKLAPDDDFLAFSKKLLKNL